MAFKLFVVLVIINLVWSRPPDINVNVKQYINGCCPGNCCPRQDQAAENILLPHLTSTSTEVTTTTDRTTTTPARTTTTTVRTTTQDPCVKKEKGGCDQLCTKVGEEVICSCDDDSRLQEDGKTCKLFRWSAHQSGKFWHESQCPYLGDSFYAPSLASCKQSCSDNHKCTALNYNSGSKWCELLDCAVPAPEPEFNSPDWASYSMVWK